MKSKDILYENGNYWITDYYDKGSYTVFKNTVTGYSIDDSSYPHDKDGYTLAVARCDYLARRDSNG